MQKSVNQPTNQLIQQQSTVSSLPQQVIEFFQSRIETEQNYAKALLKLNNKFPNIQSQPTASSKVLKHLKAIHSEKYHQTSQFIVELKQQKQNFENAISKTNQQLQKSAKEARVHQMNLKNVLEKIGKIYVKGQEQIKSIDEKFLLKELSLLSVDYKTKNIEDSLKILDQETKICQKLKVQYEDLKAQGEKLIKKIKKHQKVIFQTSPQIQKQIIELIKRYTVQQISLIRNLQYDIDGMIKKTNIFDEAPPTQQKSAKPPKNPIVKTAKQLFKDQFKIKDIYQQAKKNIANTNEALLKSMQIKKDQPIKNSQAALQYIKKWEQTKKVEQLVAKLNENYSQYKQIGNEFIEYFRNKNMNKFNQKEFAELQRIFNLLMNKTYDQRDFQAIQKLIIYASCYTKEISEKGPTQTIMETINKKQFLSDPYFWRFLLYFAVQRSVIQCIGIQNEKQIHLKNNVFSTLVSNSLNMIGCGIDKYVTKNTVAKIAKAFGLPDNQVGDLLKFIESGYEKYEKEKGKK